MASAGLQTHIWNNNLKSVAFLALYPLVLMAIIWACAYVIGYAGAPRFADSDRAELYAIGSANNMIYDYWPIIAGIVAVWFIISFFFNTRMIAAMAHAKPVSRKDEPEIYNLMENLCISQGVAMPKFNIIETHALNAFASGINEKTYTVTVTRGLLNRLSKDEVEGVLAHELTHIINRDVRLMMIAIVFTGMVALAAQIVWSNLRYALYVPRGNDKKGGALLIMLGIVIILWIGYFATTMTRFAISRRREYMADAGAVSMTKNPEAMMRALMRISGRDRIPETTSDIALMCIENSAPFLGLFATHPPIDRRIAVLSQTTGTPVPAGLPPVADKSVQISNDVRNPWLPRTRPFRQKHNPWTGTNF